MALRRGNPLHLADCPDGTYVATLASGPPGNVKSIADNAAVVITRDGSKRGVKHVAFSRENGDVARGVLF